MCPGIISVIMPRSISNDSNIIELTPTNAICDCGRPGNKIHCPHCGSQVLYGVAVNSIRTNPETLKQEEYKQYRCRRCRRLFDDWQWINDCTAPEYNFKRKRAITNPSFDQKFKAPLSIEEQAKQMVDGTIKLLAKMKKPEPTEERRKEMLAEQIKFLKEQQEKPHV